jgi:PAS domain S-box-containing protein
LNSSPVNPVNNSHYSGADESQSLFKRVQRFQSLVENSPDLVSEVSVAGEFHYVSPGIRRVLGYSPNELLGKSIFEIVHPEDVGLAQENFLCSEGIVTCRCRHKNGSWLWLETSGRNFLAADGDVRSVLVSRDVTERMKSGGHPDRFEAQLRQAQKLEVLGTLASGIAHDFNNILAVLFAHADLAHMNIDQPELVRDSIDEIRNACDRARDLTRRILAFSRKEPRELKPVRLHAIVKEVFALMRSTLPASIEMDLHLDTTAPVVLADSTQIHQVLLNLAANAKHAMRGTRGRLMIRLDTCVVDGAQSERVRDLRPGLYARLSISDTGHGMTEDVLKRIFEPFFTTKPAEEGTGLGLAVVQGIVKEHHGAIGVSSQPGEGTTFDLYFPAHSSAIAGTYAGQNAGSAARGVVNGRSNCANLPIWTPIPRVIWRQDEIGDIPIRVISDRSQL